MRDVASAFTGDNKVTCKFRSHILYHRAWMKHRQESPRGASNALFQISTRVCVCSTTVAYGESASWTRRATFYLRLPDDARFGLSGVLYSLALGPGRVAPVITCHIAGVTQGGDSTLLVSLPSFKPPVSLFGSPLGTSANRDDGRLRYDEQGRQPIITLTLSFAYVYR